MKTRIISAIIALLIVVPVIIAGGLVFKIGVAIIGTIGLWELIKLKNKEKNIPFMLKLFSYLMFLAIVLFSTFYDNKLVLDFRFITLLLLLLLTPIVLIKDNKKYNITDALFLIASVLFLGIAFNLLIEIRNFDLNYLIFLLLITIISDTYAYLTGFLIGKHKMIPEVSPKKTWEGLIGGTVFGVFISTMFYISAFSYDKSILLLIIIITFLSIIGQLGDLVFSSIKRHFDTKDFGNIMPGHGGVLDRLDSIIFVLLAFSFVIPYL